VGKGNVFIFSISDNTIRTRYGDSTAKGFKLETILPPTVNSGMGEQIRNLYPDGRCFLWGARKRQETLTLWKEMAAEDLIVGCGPGVVLSAAFILGKMDDPEPAARIWPDSPADPYRLLCFMEEPYLGHSPIVTQLFRYLGEDCRGFRKLPPEQSRYIKEDYGTLENFVRLALGFDFPVSLRHAE